MQIFILFMLKYRLHYQYQQERRRSRGFTVFFGTKHQSESKITSFDLENDLEVKF